MKCSVPGGKESVLRFSRRLEQGDLRVRFDVERGDRSWTGAVRVRSRGHLVEARLWSDSSDPAMSQLSVDGRAAAHVPGFADELAVADGVAILRRGGRELLRAEVPTDGTRVHGVELAASHGTVAFRNLRVDQDQRWLPRRTAPRRGPSRRTRTSSSATTPRTPRTPATGR